MMYKLVGADQKEYGPVEAVQIRQWILERRLNAQSLAQAEGTTLWKPLRTFPEFEETLAQVAPAPAPLGSTMPAMMPRTNNMAIAGLVCGIISLLIGCCGFIVAIPGIIFSCLALTQINRNPQVEKGKGIAIAGLILSILGLLGGALLSIFSPRLIELFGDRF